MRTLRALALATLLLGAAGAAADQPSEVNFARVSRLDGALMSASEEDGPWKALQLRAGVVQGHYVRTGEGSRAELSFPDGSVLRLAALTTVHLSEVYFPKKAENRRFTARIVLGRLWARVRKAIESDESSFRVRVGNAVAGVRGTAFQVNYDGEAEGALIKVYEGTVAVAGKPAESEEGGWPAPSEGKQEVPGPEEVPGPAEVTVEEWMRTVERWQAIRIDQSGRPGDTRAIDPEMDKDPFSIWNLEIDKIPKP